MSKELKNMAVRMNHYGANILPIGDDKKPIGNWKEMSDQPQNLNDLTSFPWDKMTGLGVLSGPGDWRVIDIDKVDNPDIIKSILKKLGLPMNDYKWVVKSGTGYHIHVRSRLKFPAETIYKRESSVYKAKCAFKDFDHLEYRESRCQTLIPPSLHPSGKLYEFVNGEPDGPPSTFDISKMIDVFKTFTIIEDPETKEDKRNEHPDEDIDIKFLPSAIEWLSQNINDYHSWFRCGMALAALGEKGRQSWLDLSQKNPKYHDSIEFLNGKFDEFVKNKSGYLRLNTLFHIAQTFGYKYPELPAGQAGKQKNKKPRKESKEPDQKKHTDFSEEFWFEFLNPLGKRQLGIDRANFLYFLKQKGYFKMYVGYDYLFIRIQQNIVKKVNPTLIKDFVFEFIKSLPISLTENFTSIDLYNVLLKGSNVYFSTSFLEFLEPRIITFHRDKIDEAYFYFKNGWVRVTKDDYQVLPYEKLESFIWERQIINRNFSDVKGNIEDFTISEFQQFLKNVCNQDLDRYYTLKSAIGYLLHTYKDPSVARAIVFCDEQLSDDANGRSGKSLVGHAISKFRNSVRFDGRNFKQDKSFLFQQIGPDTQIVEFNDVDRRFDFEKLFSIITDAITIEKKQKDEYIIPFEQSPKILISTNYTIQADGDSADDRKFEIEFSNHYSKKYKPVDDFGHRFFDEWNESEWNRFDNFMIDCVNYFLQKGLKPYSFVNLIIKKLQFATNKEFIEFMDNEVKTNKEYSKKYVLESFIVSYPDYSLTKQNKFSYWLKKYAKIKDLKYEERKSNNERFFILIDGKIPGITLLKDKVEEKGQSSEDLFETLP